MRKPRKITDPSGRTYQVLLFELLYGWVETHPCRNCGGPVVKGFVCTRCGSPDP